MKKKKAIKWCKAQKGKYIKILLDLYQKEKEKNKKLNLENQALFESINCNDNNMLARRYQKLQKENEFLKDKIKDKIKELETEIITTSKKSLFEIDVHFAEMNYAIKTLRNLLKEN